jgi:hypothetical protein
MPPPGIKRKGHYVEALAGDDVVIVSILVSIEYRYDKSINSIFLWFIRVTRGRSLSMTSGTASKMATKAAVSDNYLMNALTNQSNFSVADRGD